MSRSDSAGFGAPFPFINLTHDMQKSFTAKDAKVAKESELTADSGRLPVRILGMFHGTVFIQAARG